MSRIVVVAEPGSTHGGSLDTMVRLVQMASDCGASGFKSQWVSNPEKLCERRNAPEYLEAYRLISYPLDWHKALRSECDYQELIYGCTTYLPEDVEKVAPFVDFHKVASFEARDRFLLDAHRDSKKPLWVSTGMMNMTQVSELVQWLLNNVKSPVLLHCVSGYPCPVDQACLKAISEFTLWDRFMKVGFSDHTCHALMGALAVAAGAKVLEVHVRLDDAESSNPDYSHALPPEKFEKYVVNVGIAQLAIGEGGKREMECERPMRRYLVYG